MSAATRRDEAALRAEICRVGRSLHARGYVHGTTGNISARLDDGFLITATDACLGELGIGFVSQEGHRLPMLNAIEIPAGADDAGLRRALLERHGIEIGGGLGELKGRAWRVGLMGHGATTDSVDALMTALRAELGR